MPTVAEAALEQDQEFCHIEVEGRRERVRFHDYSRIYSVPGLYEELFYNRLKCDSPRVVSSLLSKELEKEGVAADTLRALDVGAGNGMVAEELRRIGVAEAIGVDIIPEAKMAAKRDRPEVYRDYLVADLTQLADDDRQRAEAMNPNLFVTVAALGFGDIPARAFATGWNLTSDGWAAMNIKETFLEPRADDTGFSKLVRRMLAEGVFEAPVQHRYQHRIAISGEPLHYIALIGRKRRDIPEAWLAELGA